MRLIAATVAFALMATACHAQSLAAQTVAIFKQTCTEATTPDAMIVAGENSAAAGKWKLIGSGPAPLPMLHNYRGPKVSYFTQWEINLPEMPRATLAMSIVRSTPEGIKKFSVCVLQPTTELGANELARQIEEQFGPSVTKDISGRYRDEARWFFTSERAVGNCGRTIPVFFNQMSSRGTPATLLFSDIKLAEGWPGSEEMSKCP